MAEPRMRAAAAGRAPCLDGVARRTRARCAAHSDAAGALAAVVVAEGDWHA